MGKHLVFGFGIFHPARPGVQIHWTQFPAFGGVIDARLETQFLLLVADREPVLDQDDARADQHPFELRDRTQELAIFFIGTKAHHPFDVRPGCTNCGRTEPFRLPAGRCAM